MCGFFGEFSNELLNVEDFRNNLQRSFQRGPDQQEIWSDGNLYQVGFNRLSILDLTENGKQPLLSPSGRYSLVINGEIYNYKILRRELEILGHIFITRSDTEVILKSYEEWGINCCKRLRGIFAFAIWDIKKKTLFIARDHLGVKPLYYFQWLQSSSSLFHANRANQSQYLHECQSLPFSIRLD